MAFRRMASTTRSGHGFDRHTVELVWQKAQPVFGNLFRRDACGKLIARHHYGNRSSALGWEIDHIKPVARGGSDALINLQPLQWQNNAHKGDTWPRWTCKVR